MAGVGATKLVTYLGGFGAPTVKPLGIFYTHETALAEHILCKTCKASKRRVAASGRPRKLWADDPRPSGRNRRRSTPLSNTGWRKDVWVNGKQQGLRDSAQYPTEFAQALCDLVLQSRGR
eukprot:9494294-Pyramimonas_sp.AAC.1